MIKTKTQIDPFIDKWDSIKFMLNDFELVDIYRSQEVAEKRYAQPIIDYKKQGYIFSRAFFKLWEVLSEYKVLDGWINKPIRICCLCEGPGGFIQSLIDFRNLQHQKQWASDMYTAITLKMNGGAQGHDWEFYRAKQYFQRNKKFDVRLSYGKGDGNLLDLQNIKLFVEKDLDNKKQELVTADGGIEVKGEYFNIQELCC